MRRVVEPARRHGVSFRPASTDVWLNRSATVDSCPWPGEPTQVPRSSSTDSFGCAGLASLLGMSGRWWLRSGTHDGSRVMSLAITSLPRDAGSCCPTNQRRGPTALAGQAMWAMLRAPVVHSPALCRQPVPFGSISQNSESTTANFKFSMLLGSLRPASEIVVPAIPSLVEGQLITDQAPSNLKTLLDPTGPLLPCYTTWTASTSVAGSAPSIHARSANDSTTSCSPTACAAHSSRGTCSARASGAVAPLVQTSGTPTRRWKPQCTRPPTTARSSSAGRLLRLPGEPGHGERAEGLLLGDHVLCSPGCATSKASRVTDDGARGAAAASPVGAGDKDVAGDRLVHPVPELSVRAVIQHGEAGVVEDGGGIVALGTMGVPGDAQRRPRAQ